MRKIQNYILRKNCQYCHTSDIRLMTQEEFYGRRYNDSKLYVCQKCNARVGTHPGTDIPLGCLADKELMGLRKSIHEIIDKKWKTKEERSIVYAKLAEKYGETFHVGFLKNERARYILLDLERDSSFLDFQRESPEAIDFQSMVCRQQKLL